MVVALSEELRARADFLEPTTRARRGMQNGENTDIHDSEDDRQANSEDGRQANKAEQKVRSPIDTIYFGGGTPSVLSPAQVGILLDTSKDIWGPTAGHQEITLEANPEDLTPTYLEALLKAGINRLSIGIQSFDNKHLALMNRRHTGAQAAQAVRMARAAGFANITVDLIYGLPFMSADQWRGNVERVVDLAVEHVSAYHLGIERRTVFGKRGLQEVTQEVSDEHFRVLQEVLLGGGYEHYEISNFARPGCRSIHNSGYWSGVPYLGIGPSAHSFDGVDLRCWNPSSNKQYLEGQGAECEKLSAKDRRNEMVMTRLRTADGIFVDKIEDQAFKARLLDSAQKWLDRGWMVLRADGWLSILPEYFLVSDGVIADFFE